MARGQNKTGLIITIIVLGLTLLIVSGIVLWRNMTPPADTSDETTQTTDQNDATAEDTPATTDDQPTDQPDEKPPAVDPSTLNSIDIEPLGITVFYTKGLPGFEFQIKRTASGTEYIDFTASQLVGTKCTDDSGLFASIIKNPDSQDQTTISATTTVGEDSYGLALTGKNCTPDEDLLKTYHSAFTNGFGSLKEME